MLRHAGLFHVDGEQIIVAGDSAGAQMASQIATLVTNPEYASEVGIIPSLRPQVSASSVQPAWGLGFLGELYMWGVVVSFLLFGWRYNSFLIMQGVVVSLGLSLVARAFVAKPKAA